MDTLLEKFDDVINSGDEEVRTWFLIREKYLPFIVCGCYALFCSTIGPALMKNRKPFELRHVMVFFNFFVVAVYTVSLILTFLYLPRVPKESFCKSGKILKGDITYTLGTVAWVIYLLKYLEFLDTVFFILRKKEQHVTFLHIVHHTIVPLFMWFVFRTEKNGMQSIPLILNGIVHIIMYSYYGLAAMGPSVRQYLWWKKYLTQLQMIQFILIILFVAVVAPLSGCPMILSSYVIDGVGATFFLYLFYKFYRLNFHPVKKEKI